MSKQVNIGINGFGRIGRIAFRIAVKKENVNVVAINDLVPVDQLAHLLKYDSVHGRFDGEVSVEDGDLVIDGNKIRMTSETDPKNLAWDEKDVDVVLECTGIFKEHEQASGHLEAGAKKVVISAPSKDAPMFVMGVNHKDVSASDKIVSNASCTTNCLAPISKVLNDKFGIAEGLMTTVHAATSTQSTVDIPAKKNYRIGRSSLNNIIPTSTGAAVAVTKVIPELKGKLTGMAFRVPTDNVSVVDLTFRSEKDTSLDEIKAAFKEASENEMKGTLGYTEDELVSQDFVGESCTSVVDADASMELNSNFFKIVSWYDNEYGYSSSLVDLVLYVNSLSE